jgi:hypothetical protein
MESGLASSAIFIVGGVLVAGASGVAAERRATTVPVRLVGEWAGRVTSADVKREHGAVDIATGDVSGTFWTLTIKKSGASSLSCIRYWSGRVQPAGVSRVHINIGIPYPNVYRWRVTGRRLTLRKVNDSLPVRAAVLQGVWRR